MTDVSTCMEGLGYGDGLWHNQVSPWIVYKGNLQAYQTIQANDIPAREPGLIVETIDKEHWLLLRQLALRGVQVGQTRVLPHPESGVYDDAEARANVDTATRVLGGLAIIGVDVRVVWHTSQLTDHLFELCGSHAELAAEYSDLTPNAWAFYKDELLVHARFTKYGPDGMHQSPVFYPHTIPMAHRSYINAWEQISAESGLTLMEARQKLGLPPLEYDDTAKAQWARFAD